jgi:hypothetical protein
LPSMSSRNSSNSLRSSRVRCSTFDFISRTAVLTKGRYHLPAPLQSPKNTRKNDGIIFCAAWPDQRGP